MHPLADQLGLLDLKPVRRGGEEEGGWKRAKKGEICLSQKKENSKGATLTVLNNIILDPLPLSLGCCGDE